MSQVSRFLLYGVVSLGLCLGLSACGDTNSESGAHRTGWLPAGHGTVAKANVEGCVGCHGENLDGGISKVACTTCHLGGSQSVHPQQWGSFAYARHKAYLELPGNTSSSCANASCHGVTLAGVSGSGPSCTSCHMGGVTKKHPATWTQYSSHGNFVKASGYVGCSNAACHGNNARGVFLSGPSCFVCHPAAPNAVAPVPNKHPSNLLVNSTFTANHGDFVQANGTATCLTAICHGTGGTGPSCSTAGCH